MNRFISILHKCHNVSVPLNADGNVNLNLLKNYFPGAVGLTYKSDGKLCIVDINKDQLLIVDHNKTYNVTKGFENGSHLNHSGTRTCEDSQQNINNIDDKIQSGRAELKDKDRVHEVRTIMDAIRAAKKSTTTDQTGSRSTKSKAMLPAALPHKKKNSIIHVGWLHKSIDAWDQIRHTQVKMPTGGVRRLELRVDNTYSVDDIISSAKEMFFSTKSVIPPVGEIQNLNCYLGHRDGTLIEEFKDVDGVSCGLWNYFKSLGVPSYRYNIYLITEKKSEDQGYEDPDMTVQVPNTSLMESTLGSTEPISVRTCNIASTGIITLRDGTHGVFDGVIPERKLYENRDMTVQVPNALMGSTETICVHTDIAGTDMITFEDGSHAIFDDIGEDENPLPTGALLCNEPDKLHDMGPEHPNIEITYHEIKLSKYTASPSIIEKNKLELYTDLENARDIPYIDFDPLDYGYKICRIKKNGQVLLNIDIKDNLEKIYTFPSLPKPIQKHTILYDVDELSGSCSDGSLGMGFITSCTDACKPIFTWYNDGEVIKQGESLYWITTTGGSYSCKIECSRAEETVNQHYNSKRRADMGVAVNALREAI